MSAQDLRGEMVRASRAKGVFRWVRGLGRRALALYRGRLMKRESNNTRLWDVWLQFVCMLNDDEDVSRH